ncbi:MAG: helix-turn-helix domain-containing protein [Mycobacteriales bacterium]
MATDMPGFDPERHVVVDPRNLRGIAHPLRVRLLGLLRELGPSTATRLAEQLGQSSGATSYHLRQLAAYGFVAEETGRGTGRERWWRAVHRRSWFDLPPDAPEEDWLAGEQYIRAVWQVNASQVEAALDELSTLDPRWHDAFTMSDTRLQLHPEEAAELGRRMRELVDEYRKADDGERPAGSRQVVVQYQMFPRGEEA